MIKIKIDCLHCPDSRVVSTGSTLIIYCPFQQGTRNINDVCNLEKKTNEVY